MTTMSLRACSCLFRRMTTSALFRSSQIVGYKSQYNVQHLYPNSNPDLTANTVLKHTEANSAEFSGVVPVDKLQIQYSRSSGPGGQNVNKVNTKVEIRFHVPSAEWLSQVVRDKLLEAEKNRITRDGYLIVTSDKTRKQILNQADCIEKIRSMVWNANKKPYEPTEEDLLVAAQRKEKVRRSVLRQKKEHAMKKQSRRKPDVHSI